MTGVPGESILTYFLSPGGALGGEQFAVKVDFDKTGEAVVECSLSSTTGDAKCAVQKPTEGGQASA